MHLTIDGQSITDVRYWFDQNDADAVTETLASSPWQDALDVSMLSEGWHVVHFAFRDDLGQWSSVESNRFRKRNSSTNEVNAVTYWFDENDGFQVTSPVIGTTWANSLDISTLSVGWHRIHFYFHDTRGQKSSATTARFRKDQMAGNELVLAEYWFDEDDASSESTAITGQTISFSEGISSADVSTGWHVVHLRFTDERGQPSSVISSRTRIVDGDENRILLAKFWFDDCDADDQFVYEYQSPDSEIVFFTCTCLSPCNPVVGDHQMNVQFQDIRGAWSSVLSETLFFNDTPCTTDCRADINGDGIVDILDFIELNSAFGLSCTDCPADINDDGIVDILDFIIFNSSFGKICDYAFENDPPVAPPTDDLQGTLELRPDIEVHEEIQKVLSSTTTAQMNAYPNPVQSDELYIRLTGMVNTPVTEVQLMDALGRIVYRQSYRLNGPEALLRLELPAGIAVGSYSVRLLLADGLISTVIVVE